MPALPIEPSSMPLPQEPPELTPDGLPNPEATDDGRHSIIQSMLSKIDSKHAATDQQVILNTEKIRQMKKQMLNNVFDTLKKAGVDPSDPQAINEFLQQLADADPDLLKLFEDAFTGLHPDSSSQGFGGNLLPMAPPPGGDMPGMDPGLIDRMRSMPTDELAPPVQ